MTFTLVKVVDGIPTQVLTGGIDSLCMSLLRQHETKAAGFLANLPDYKSKRPVRLGDTIELTHACGCNTAPTAWYIFCPKGK